jgi:branched-chain amino acid transport system substrate-binding protein
MEGVVEHADRSTRAEGSGRAAVFAPAAMLAFSLAASLCATSAARAQDDDVTKIGVLNDMSGLYADIGGAGSVAAAKLAVEDFNPAAHGMKVEVVSGDHQNKPDVGANLARQWYDADHVDAIFDVPTSSVALAVSEVTREKNKVFVGSGPASSDLTGPKCSPNTVHWTYDTWMLANGTGKAVVQTGGDTWYFLTADYAFGQALERDTSKVVAANGGKVVGSVRHPLNTADFSSFLLQAQSSKAKIIGLANAGGDTVNAIKQGAEFGIASRGQHFAGLLVFINDVEALGLKTAQGLVLTETWYWDMTDANRAFAKALAGGLQPAGEIPEHAARRRLFVGHPLFESGRSAQERQRRPRRGRQDERTADRRSAVRQRLDPYRRPQAARRLSVRSEEAGRIKISGRRLQAACHHSGGGSVPAAQGGRLSAGRRLMRAAS